eukprot:358583-Chlamydomonas_euryale.AAC.5
MPLTRRQRASARDAGRLELEPQVSTPSLPRLEAQATQRSKPPVQCLGTCGRPAAAGLAGRSGAARREEDSVSRRKLLRGALARGLGARKREKLSRRQPEEAKTAAHEPLLGLHTTAFAALALGTCSCLLARLPACPDAC